MLNVSHREGASVCPIAPPSSTSCPSIKLGIITPDFAPAGAVDHRGGLR